MGLFSIVGRLLFASYFLIPAWKMYFIALWYKNDNNPVTKELLAAKLTDIQDIMSSRYGGWTRNIAIDIISLSTHLALVAGVSFIANNHFAACMLVFHMLFLTPQFSRYDFYNYNYGEPKFWELLKDATQYMAVLGALLFYLDMKFELLREQQRRTKKKKPKTKTN